MLTKADDYPVHQLPEPIATAGTDRNFYDRYFFNGYTPDGDLYFAVAFGVYPHLNIMDGAFSVISNGVQRNLHVSRFLNGERMDTKVGPLSIEIVEPLDILRVRVGDNPHGMKADVTFHARALPVEEPRFTYRQGPRTLLDYTRLTQNGAYEGFIEIQGKRIDLTRPRILGTRDRSWGIRPVGAADQQPLAPPRMPQFYWLWSPLNFDDRFVLYHLNADGDGHAWNTASVLGGLGDALPVHMQACSSRVTYKSGTRHAKRTVIDLTDPAGAKWQATLDTKYNFYMSGIGYTNPEWGHGHFKGESAIGYDEYETAKVDENDPRFQHVQAFVTATLKGPDGERKGHGILEQLVIGAYKPHGLTGIFDPAP